MFLNRQRELGYLDSRYRRQRAEIAVIYGRRRVGKSALAFEWCRDKRHALFFAQRLDGATLLRQFSRELAAVDAGLENVPTDFSYPDWEAAFRALGDLTTTERLVVVIDEYPYLVEMVPGISTVLQKVWDLALQHTNLFLILTGSLLSVMHRHVLDVEAPLYRRHTWPFELRPLRVGDLAVFFPRRTPAELVETYAVLGGMPHYLIAVDPEASLLQNIEQDILSPAGSLFDEPRLQLHEELRGDIEPYLRILGAIANGAHRRREIASGSAVGDASKVGWYLGTLVELGLVEHRQPVGRIRKPTRWGTYHLRDPFFRFWHRWVLPRRNYLAIGQGQRETLDRIRRDMFHVVAPVWEEVARSHLYAATAQGEIPVQIEEIGSWWARGAQIDLVAVNRAERCVILGEAKWQRRAVTQVDLDRLLDRSLRWLEGDPYWDIHYVFFAREFGKVQEDVADDDHIHFYTPADVVTR